MADEPSFYQAQRWFLREKTWISDQHLQLCRIAAPTFFEAQRAGWLAEQLGALGWNASLDRSGNVVATSYDAPEDKPRIAVTAHLDTVLAPNRPEDILVAPDGRLQGPGVSDNGAGLVALLALARVLREFPELHDLAASLLLVANVGEEGEGNLSGMRYLCQHLPKAGVRAFVVLDGPSVEHITAQALASRRFEVSFAGPGGHSWNDHGTANPVHALSQVISNFAQAVETPRTGLAIRPRFSFNFGIVEGGSSINSIPASARSKLDLRSANPDVLDELSALLTSSVERALERENRLARESRLTAKIKDLGSRPGGGLRADAVLLRTVQAVDQHLRIRSRVDCASTDANIPLSLGLPAVSIGTGGQGGGAHTAQEWYLPEGRELGLRRLLLLLAALNSSPLPLDHDTVEVPAQA